MKTSAIWNFFTEKPNSDTIAVCNICKKDFSFKSSSNNLKKHLEKKHPLINFKNNDKQERNRDRSRSPTKLPDTSIVTGANANDEAEERVSAESNREMSQNSGSSQKSKVQTHVNIFLKRKMGISSKKNLDNNLMLLFYKDFQPFSIVEDYGFRKFVNSLNPSYEIPSRKTISNTLLEANYEEIYNLCKRLITDETIMAVTLTTDSWTSRNTENFLAVTCHFITEEFELRNVLLECSTYAESHTSKNLAKELKKTFDEWNISSKILLMVSDNAANIKKAIKDELQMKHFGCYAHTINLILQDSLKLITPILDKIRTIVAHFKRSTSATAKLIEQQKNMNNSNPLKLIIDVSTRWNSAYYMLERFVALEDPIRSAIALLNKNLPILSVEEWQFLKEIVQILRPMENLTTFISGQNYLTASSAIILTDGILNIYENLKNQNFLPLGLDLIKSILEGIRTRLGDLENSNSLTLATFLDPRYKTIGFSNPQTAEKVKQNVISRVTSLIKEKSRDFEDEHANRPEEDSGSGMSLWEQFEKRKKITHPVGSAHSKAILEVQRYIDEPVISRTENPLNWWKKNSYNFPNLAIMVRRDMVTVATSVPCESLFSKSGQILSDRRSRLNSTKVKKLLFLNTNRDCFFPSK